MRMKTVTRWIAASIAPLALAHAPASAYPAGPGTDLSEEIGSSSYSVAFVSLYDATLWGPEEEFRWEQPFALELSYSRKIRGDKLAETTISEMARLTGKTEKDFAMLTGPLGKCFPDVVRGDRITGVSRGQNTASFYHNSRKTCDITWPDFRSQFFGIWLGENSRAPLKSAELRGE